MIKKKKKPKKKNINLIFDPEDVHDDGTTVVVSDMKFHERVAVRHKDSMGGP